jgi:carboxymethylenebutenolidase
MGDMVEFASNGSKASGYLAVPESGSGPGIIVIQEWWGLVPHIKDVADRFAAEGFVALAPDLFHGETTTEPDEAGKLMMAMNIERAAKDLNGAVEYLLGVPFTTLPGIGVVGFCMGGGLTLALACARPDVVWAAAPFYGVIPWPDLQPDYSAMTASIRGHFGELDGFFGPDLARKLEEQLIDLGKDATIVIHEGCDHAFFNDTRPEVYQAEHAEEAWEQTLDLFRTTLT